MLSRGIHVITYINSLVWNPWQIEDGLENLFFHKIILRLLSSYLKDYLTPCHNLRTYLTRFLTQKRIKTFPAKTKHQSSFIPHCAEAWGNLSEERRNINSINTCRSSILNFVRPRENSVFEVHDIKDVKLLTRLRLDFIHLNEHKFRHSFNDVINPMCSCGKESETTQHYLLCSDFYFTFWSLIYRLELVNDIYTLNGSLKNSSEEKLLKILLYRAEDFTSQMNSKILKCKIKFIKKTDRFSGPLFLSYLFTVSGIYLL